MPEDDDRCHAPVRSRRPSVGRAALRGLPLASALVLAGCVDLTRPEGPLPVRNVHPTQLTVLVMPATDTRDLAPGEGRVRWNTAYGSVFLADSRNLGSPAVDRVDLDMEYLRTSVSAEVGLGNGFRLRTELPAGHTTGGFLDDFVIDFHDTLGLSDQGRPLVENDRFLGIAERGGDRVLQMEERGFELLDVPIELSWVGREAGRDGPFGFGFRAGIELPTGDGAAGYGNDQVDFGFGAFCEWRPQSARWLAMTAHVEHTFAGTPDRARSSGFGYADVTSGGVGLEMALSSRWSALVQLEVESSTLEGLGVTRAERLQNNLWTGLRWSAFERGFVELGFAEDVFGYSSADFTAWLGIGARWGD